MDREQAMVGRRTILAGAGLFLLGGQTARGADREALKALGDGRVVALIRHARAPGTGDPPGFRLGDCTTQRNLSEEGRRQAALLGERLRRADALVPEVRSSRWCRALDTARLAFPDVPTTPDATLDSFFEDRTSRDRQTEATRALVSGWRGRQGVLALVTHQVNITALTGVVPGEGEVVVLRPAAAGFTVVGRVQGLDA